MDMKDTIALLSSFVALVLGLYAALNQRRTSYINAITSERVRWIDKVRSAISEYSGVVHRLTHLPPSISADGRGLEDYLKDRRDLERLLNVIKLLMNPDEKDHDYDRTILERTKAVRSAFLSVSPPNRPTDDQIKQMMKDMDEVTDAAQKYLKKEWNRVKQEADRSLWS